MRKLGFPIFAFFIFFGSFGLSSYFLSFSAFADDNKSAGFFSQALGTAYDYWSPKADKALQVAQDYWQPKIDEAVDVSYQYWEPQVSRWLSTSQNYWSPRLDQEILPYVRSHYVSLETSYGPQVSNQYRLITNYWAKVIGKTLVETETYLHDLAPERMDSIRRIPAPIKIEFDHFEGWGLKKLIEAQNDPEKSSKIPQVAKRILDTLARSLVPSKDPAFIGRVNRALERVKYAAADPAMIEHYRIEALESADVYAFNTGCSIYVTSALAAMLSDDELAAAIAHEVSHGDQGHLVKNFLELSKIIGVHLPKLIAEETEWFLTGNYGPYLSQVLKEGSIEAMLSVYGPRGLEVEIQADVGAVGILMDSGISPNALKTALMKLHGVAPGTVVEQNEEAIHGIRDYPSLYSRLKAIDQAATQHR